MLREEPQRREHHDLHDDDRDVGAGHPASIAGHRGGRTLRDRPHEDGRRQHEKLGDHKRSRVRQSPPLRRRRRQPEQRLLDRIGVRLREWTALEWILGVLRSAPVTEHTGRANTHLVALLALEFTGVKHFRTLRRATPLCQVSPDSARNAAPGSRASANRPDPPEVRVLRRAVP